MQPSKMTDTYAGAHFGADLDDIYLDFDRRRSGTVTHSNVEWIN